MNALLPFCQGAPKHKFSNMAMSPISEEMVNDAQQAWCDGLLAEHCDKIG
jgi:hypothetical protein